MPDCWISPAGILGNSSPKFSDFLYKPMTKEKLAQQPMGILVMNKLAAVFGMGPAEKAAVPDVHVEDGPSAEDVFYQRELEEITLTSTVDFYPQ